MQPADAEPDRLETLAEEMTQLRDLFQRRLFEDKAKAKLYDELYEQLALARGGLADQLLAPLFRELLLVVDRIDRLIDDGDEALTSVHDELIELLARREVRPVPPCARFDPAYQEAVRAEPADGVESGHVLDVLRQGYMMGDRLLRPEQVVVSVGERSTTTEESGPEPDQQP